MCISCVDLGLHQLSDKKSRGVHRQNPWDGGHQVSDGRGSLPRPVHRQPKLCLWGQSIPSAQTLVVLDGRSSPSSLLPLFMLCYGRSPPSSPPTLTTFSHGVSVHRQPKFWLWGQGFVLGFLVVGSGVRVRVSAFPAQFTVSPNSACGVKIHGQSKLCVWGQNAPSAQTLRVGSGLRVRVSGCGVWWLRKGFWLRDHGFDLGFQPSPPSTPSAQTLLVGQGLQLRAWGCGSGFHGNRPRSVYDGFMGCIMDGCFVGWVWSSRGRRVRSGVQSRSWVAGVRRAVNSA